MNSNYKVTVTVRGTELGTYVVSASSPFMAKHLAGKQATENNTVAGELRFKVAISR